MSRPSEPALDRQVAASLRVYLDRGEFDGTSLDQARRCLQRAGYAWRPDVQASARRFVSRGGAAEGSRLPSFSPAHAYPAYHEQDEPGAVDELTPQEIEADVLSVVGGGRRW